MLIEKEEFIEKCIEGKCPRYTIYNKKTCSKSGKQTACYRKYVSSIEKNKEKDEKKRIKTSEWTDIRDIVFTRDNNECVYLAYLKSLDNKLDYAKALHLAGNQGYDPAHIFGKGIAPELANEPDNVVTLTRVFHSRLDTYRHPLTNEPITKEKRLKIFLSMISKNQKKSLLKLRGKNT